MSTGVDGQVAVVVLSAVAGLVVGSFANVLVFRLPRHLSIVKPPSHCPACDTRLGPAELVPVASWLALRGRCRHCQARIPVRYPLVELANGVLFAAVAGALGSLWPLPALLVLAACTLAAAVIDTEGSSLPTPLAVAAGASALALLGLAPGLGQLGRDEWAAVGAALAMVVTLVVQRGAHAGLWQRIALLGALGCAAGWLWAGGGAFVAAWVVVAAAATGSAGSKQQPPLALVCGGALLAVLASAVIARP